jgi:hypothetical protein
MSEATNSEAILENVRGTEAGATDQRGAEAPAGGLSAILST